MLRLVIALSGFAALASDALSRPVAPELPKGVPPLIGTAIAKAGPDQKWQVEVTVPKVRWELVGKVVPKSEWPRVESAVENVTLTLRLGEETALIPSKVVDLKGDALAPAEAQRRLKAETPVLVAVGNAMPDRYYLQLTRDDALIVLLGPGDKAPLPELLPAPKDAGAVRAKDATGAPDPRK